MNVTHATPDRTTTPMTYDEAVETCARLHGQRVRLTYPNGARFAGLVEIVKRSRDTRWRPDAPDAEPYITLDGAMKLGELAGAVLIERMVNGRYVQVER
jgi:hypothetical protein